MSTEKIIKFISRGMTAAWIAARMHHTLREHSPAYSQWVDSQLLKTKKKLGMIFTLETAIRQHLGATDEEEIRYDMYYLHPTQISVLNSYLYKNILIKKMLIPRNNPGEIILDNAPHLLRRDIRDCTFLDSSEVGIITCPVYSSPEEVLIEPPSATSKGFHPVFITFASYKDAKIVVQLADHGFFFCFRQADAEILAPFLADINRIVKNESCLKGLVCGFSTYRNSVRSIGSDSVPSGSQNSIIDALRNSISENPADPIGINIKASKDLRYGIKEIDYGLFSPEIRNLLQKDLPGFISQMDKLCDEGYDARRSYLLEGPPGTGKSYIIKALISSLPSDFTTILIEKNNVNSLVQISNHSFLFPALVLIEDVDLLLDDRERRQTLLNFLDGIFAPQKMITVMTSNCLNDISDSIKARPGRVDRVINVGPGDAMQRRAQLKSLSRTLKAPLPMERIIECTDGATVAHLRELVRRARIYTPEFEGIVSEEALDDVLDEYRRDHGNKRGINQQN